MGMLAELRGRVGLRHRLRDPIAAKHEAQLRWWTERWEPIVRGGGVTPDDTLAYLDDEELAPTYLGRRWQIARAHVRRVLDEAAINDQTFFDDKVVVDLGCGPVGFPDACPARVSIGVDPLVERYAEHGLLLPHSRAVYIRGDAEQIPLLSASVDVVVARDVLDYVVDPEQSAGEIRRILRPAGTLIVGFDVDQTPTAAQPQALTVERVSSALAGMTVTHRREWEAPFATSGHRVVLVAARDVES